MSAKPYPLPRLREVHSHSDTPGNRLGRASGPVTLRLQGPIAALDQGGSTGGGKFLSPGVRRGGGGVGACSRPFPGTAPEAPSARGVPGPGATAGASRRLPEGRGRRTEQAREGPRQAASPCPGSAGGVGGAPLPLLGRAWMRESNPLPRSHLLKGLTRVRAAPILDLRWGSGLCWPPRTPPICVPEDFLRLHQPARKECRGSVLPHHSCQTLIEAAGVQESVGSHGQIAPGERRCLGEPAGECICSVPQKFMEEWWPCESHLEVQLCS